MVTVLYTMHKGIRLTHCTPSIYKMSCVQYTSLKKKKNKEEAKLELIQGDKSRKSLGSGIPRHVLMLRIRLSIILPFGWWCFETP